MSTVDSWHGWSRDGLRTHWDVPELHLYDVVGSTNDVVRTLLARGAPAGTLVLARAQTAGRGQHGRAWHSQPDQSLLFSILLRPRAEAPALGAVPLRIGLALARAIERVAGIVVRLKWPNDVLAADGGKLAGILCEGAVTGGRAAIVAGVGLNVLQKRDDFPADVAATAASLNTAGAAGADVVELMRAFLRLLDPAAERVGDPLDERERNAYHVRDALRERMITIDGEAGGVACGVQADGALLVRTDAIRPVRTGTVRIAMLHPGGRNAE